MALFINFRECKSLCAKIYFDKRELDEIKLEVLTISSEQAEGLNISTATSK